MFSQDVIDYLNRDDIEQQVWFENNELLQPLLSNPHLIIQPTLMPNVRCVQASDNEYGRIISIEQRTYKWSYLIRLSEKQADFSLIDDLLKRIDMVDGRCRIANNFLVLELPLGFYLEIIYEDWLRFLVRKIEYVDLGML